MNLIAWDIDDIMNTTIDNTHCNLFGPTNLQKIVVLVANGDMLELKPTHSSHIDMREPGHI